MAKRSVVKRPIFLTHDVLVPYLAKYHFIAADLACWKETPNKEAGVQLSMHVQGHHKADGHTQYVVVCKLLDSGAVFLEWNAQRRLAQLREDLHDPVKRELGTKGYNQAFKEAPFAQRGGLMGTTLRLNNWCAALAASVNCGDVPPILVCCLLQFLEAPEPPDASAPGIRTSGTTPSIPLEEPRGDQDKPEDGVIRQTTCKLFNEDDAESKVEVGSTSPKVETGTTVLEIIGMAAGEWSVQGPDEEGALREGLKALCLMWELPNEVQMPTTEHEAAKEDAISLMIAGKMYLQDDMISDLLARLSELTEKQLLVLYVVNSSTDSVEKASEALADCLGKIEVMVYERLAATGAEAVMTELEAQLDSEQLYSLGMEFTLCVAAHRLMADGWPPTPWWSITSLAGSQSLFFNAETFQCSMGLPDDGRALQVQEAPGGSNPEIETRLQLTVNLIRPPPEGPADASASKHPNAETTMPSHHEGDDQPTQAEAADDIEQVESTSEAVSAM